VPESWAPDSKRFLFEVTKGSNVSLWAFSLDDDKKAMPFGGVQSGTPITAAFSPDGRWVVYHSDETGRDAIYVQPFPATGAKYQVPKNDPSQNDHHPVWSSDGRELFYIPAFGALAAVSVTTQPSFAFGNAVPVPRKFTGGNTNSAPSNEREYDVTPDGKIVGPTLASAQTQTGTPTAPEIRVVLNWFEELKRLVPTN
jgi:Tol biopolymer transport system component